jgi:hypothetical protein
MRNIYFLLVIYVLLFISCANDSTTPTSNSNEYSIIGKIVDKSSGQGLQGTLVKIESNQNAYQAFTGEDGSFGFQNINSGEYLLSTETSLEGKIIIDTCGYYNTESTNWGTIYTDSFASIIGIVHLEGASDHSFINVQLLGTDKSALTTNQGNFRIDFIFPDTYDIYISKEGTYKEIRINDLEIKQGDIINVDTTMSYRFKPLVLEEESELDFLINKNSGFCYANGYFWYTNGFGLIQYDQINQTEEQVYIHSPFYLGDPYVTYDYDDGIWLSGDEPYELYYRKYSISENAIIDSIRLNSLPLHDLFRIAYDPLSDNLVLFESYTAFFPKIHKLDFQSGAIQTVDLQIEEFDFNNYKNINIDRIFIAPTGKVYFIIITTDLNDIRKYYLYLCNNVIDLKLIQIYKFPDSYKYFNRLSYYNNEIYIIGAKVHKLVL